jgi:hypothetical protein
MYSIKYQLIILMLQDFKLSYIYVNSYVNFNLNKKIIKFKITILLHPISYYSITSKNTQRYIKKYNHEIKNELNYIIWIQKVTTTHKYDHT